jgi:catalase
MLPPAPSGFSGTPRRAKAAFRFINQPGFARHGRYRISPKAGVEHLDYAAVKMKGENYLFDELARRIAADPVEFDIHVQIANEQDVVDAYERYVLCWLSETAVWE